MLHLGKDFQDENAICKIWRKLYTWEKISTPKIECKKIWQKFYILKKFLSQKLEKITNFLFKKLII